MNERCADACFNPNIEIEDLTWQRLVITCPDCGTTYRGKPFARITRNEDGTVTMHGPPIDV